MKKIDREEQTMGITIIKKVNLNYLEVFASCLSFEFFQETSKHLRTYLLV